jgi:tetratricopeptide (TPR) repeat protein
MKALRLSFFLAAKAAKKTNTPKIQPILKVHMEANQLAARRKTKKFTPMATHDEESQHTPFCQDFWEKISQRLKKDERILQTLSQHYNSTGNLSKSLQIDRKILKLRPNDPIAHYNLACDFALKKKTKEACDELAKAIQLGYNDWQWIREDTDFDGIRHTDNFRQLLPPSQP